MRFCCLINGFNSHSYNVIHQQNNFSAVDILHLTHGAFHRRLVFESIAGHGACLVNIFPAYIIRILSIWWEKVLGTDGGHLNKFRVHCLTRWTDSRSQRLTIKCWYHCTTPSPTTLDCVSPLNLLCRPWTVAWFIELCRTIDHFLSFISLGISA